MPNEFPFEFLVLVIAFGVSLWIARWFGKASQNPVLREKDRLLEQAERSAREHRQNAVDAVRRAESAQSISRDLERSLSELPEIAQRLSATRNLREIPNCALELVQEVFDAQYAIFYKCDRTGLVAVATQGDSEFAVGHRLEQEEGVAGWTAVKQLPLTPEEIEFESGVVRGRNLAKGTPEAGFSMSLPVIRGHQTIGVILVGPCERMLPRAIDLGRTIALMTSVAITSTVVFREQEQLAQTDGLTGLLNKSRILHCVESAIAGEERSCRTLSVFLFDIDHFKHYNDTNGHLPGDQLLKAVSDLLQSCLREGEHVGRYGGEEFLLVLADVEKEEALKAAERIREKISSHPFAHGKKQPLGRLSVSGGVANWPTDGPDVKSLISRADEALYQAKHAGRDRVFAYTPSDLAPLEILDLVVEVEPGSNEDEATKPSTERVEPR
jgi:diguanylate cyclase (GGDEF)-like protein